VNVLKTKPLRYVLLGVILTLSVIGALSVSALADQSMSKSPKMGWDEDDGTVTTSVGDFSVKVVVRGQMVHFQFWNESDPSLRYNVNFVSLIEFEDLNDDGVFQREEMKSSPQAPEEPKKTPEGPNTTTDGSKTTTGGSKTTTEEPETTTGSVPKPAGATLTTEGAQTILPLAKVEWTFEGFKTEVNDEDEPIAVHFTFISTVINDPTYSDVILEFRCHLYLDPQEFDLDGTTYPLLGSTELKFDIIVENWPWATPDNLMALLFHIKSESDDSGRHGTPVASEFSSQNKLNVSEQMNQTQRFKGTAEPKQQFHFEVENQVAAYFAFANQVKVKNKDSESFGSVECSYMTDGANVQIYLTFPHFEERMEYDPSVGIGDPSSDSLPEQKAALKTGWDADSGTVSTSIGDFVIQVVGRGEVLHIQFWNGSDPEIKYTANFVSLIEFEDLNQDGAFQPNETKGGPQTNLPLAKVDWTFSGFQNETNDEGETIAVHFGFASAEINDLTYSDVELEIQFHLYLEDLEIALDDATYPILGETELKFDIMVANWPWAAPDNLIALRFQIRPESSNPARECNSIAEEFQARNKLNVSEAMQQAQKFKGTVEPKQQFSFEVENQVAAYFAFANQVKVKNAQGESFKSVECSYMTDGANLQVYLTFPHFEEHMEYDPSVGIASYEPTPVTTSEAPVTTSEAPVTTSEAVSELSYATLLFGVLTLLIGIMVSFKKRI